MTRTKPLHLFLNCFIHGLVLLSALMITSAAVAQSGGTIWGLDLSHHQQKIDWKKLASKEPDFIYFKATEGSTHRDTKYSDNRTQAKKHGIVSGAYHFFSYTSPGLLQAMHFIRTAKPKKGDLPPVLDVEWKKPMPSVNAVVREVTNFLNRVEKETGVRPIIYTDCMLFNQYLKGRLPKDYKLWIASYNSKPDCTCLFWQKTNRYKIDGIEGYVDYNLFMGNYKQFNSILMD